MWRLISRPWKESWHLPSALLLRHAIKPPQTGSPTRGRVTALGSRVREQSTPTASSHAAPPRGQHGGSREGLEVPGAGSCRE